MSTLFRSPLRAVLAAAVLIGCSSTQNSDSDDVSLSEAERTPMSVGRSRLAVELVDAPKDDVSEINVTIRKVTAHVVGSGWIDLMKGDPLTVDLLKLQTQAKALGFSTLPPGRVTQFRLYVDETGQNDVKLLSTGEYIDLKVPSGSRSGIKVKGTFDLAACKTSTVTLDFDGKRSIHVHPNGRGEWILRPVIHLKRSRHVDSPCEEDTANETPSTDGKPAGSTCEAAAECLSAVCSASLCEKGGTEAACGSNDDCISGQCAEGSCQAPSNAAGAGASCTDNTGCLSGECSETNTCEQSGQGGGCVQTSDCQSELQCIEGSCVPVIG